MQIQYLEIVTQNVDETCLNYEKIHGVKFSKSDQRLGNARTVKFGNGGMMGVRAPMHETEEPVTRAYLLVSDINQAVENAIKSGAEIAHPPFEIPGLGQFAIYIIGDNQHGLWQI
jgi:predicted enzyme related to lactoylglutathione lyase